MPLISSLSLRKAVPAVWALAALGLAACGDAGEPRPRVGAGAESKALSQAEWNLAPGAAEDTVLRIRRDAHSRLQTSYDELKDRLDRLWGDSLNVDSPNSGQYRRILQDARAVRDNTKVQLEKFRLSSEGVTPEIWEEIRARTELSLDTLRRFYISADSARKLVQEKDRVRESGLDGPPP
ncbi:MAG: hypothetical protein M3Y08_07715 [Fibrobacterota bacterium]|nr:hypothetical protein [Fibrobacterota bacterium]